MKKRQKILLIVLTIVALLAVGFSVWKIFGEREENIKVEETLSTSTPIITEANVVEKTVSDANSFYEINVKYPVDSKDKEKDLEVFVLNEVKSRQSDWKVGGETYNEEQALTKKFPDRAKIKYIFDLSYDTYSSPKKETVSYVLLSYEFTGGAHGSSVVNTFTFKDDGILHIEDILDLNTEGNAIKLSKILANRIISLAKDFTTEDMVNEGTGIAFLKADGKTFDAEKCKCDGFNYASNFQKFYITDEGITFLFNQYEVAPGSSGIMKAVLDWDTLNPYLK